MTGAGVGTSEHTGESHFQLCLCNAVRMEEWGPKGLCADTQTHFMNPRDFQLHFISYIK